MMIVKFWDRNGHNITREKWQKLLERDGYRQIAKDIRSDGVTVSTIWIGLDTTYERLGGSSPPLIFETMTFPRLECWRYSTEVEAREGHWRVMGMTTEQEAEKVE